MELITKLEQIGLSKREAEVYLALLQKKEFTAPELTKITTTTRTKIYEHLQNLINKGLCNESIKDRQKIYRAVKPKIALKGIIQKYEREVEKKKLVAISLEEELEETHSNNRQKDDNLDYVEILKDKNEIRNKFINLQAEAKYEMLVFNKAPYAISPEENLDDEAEIITKGIKYRGIYEFGHLKNTQDKKSFINLVNSYISIGEKIKVIKQLPVKLAIIDRRTTMLALIDPISLKPSLTTMVVNHLGFTLTQKEVFEAYWNRSLTIEDFKREQNL